MTRVLFEVENMEKDLHETKNELLRLTGQRSILNAIVVHLLAIASVKKERFEGIGCQISTEYPYILLHINEPERKDLNAFKVNLVKYMSILNSGAKRMLNVKREFLSVVDQLRKGEVRSLEPSPKSNVTFSSVVDARQRSPSPVPSSKNFKALSSKKVLIEKTLKSIELERYDFVVNIIPRLQETLEEIRLLDFSNPSSAQFDIKSISRKFSIVEKKRGIIAV